MHQIPYTPFTAFVPKLHAVPNSVHDLPKAYLLDDTDDSLAKLYNQILRFVERDLSRIMDLAEKVMFKPSSSISRPLKGSVELSTLDNETEDDKKGFQILTNVVWSEISRAIVDEIGTVVFAAGRPNDFWKVHCIFTTGLDCTWPVFVFLYSSHGYNLHFCGSFNSTRSAF